MKRFIVGFVLIALVFSCKKEERSEQKTNNESTEKIKETVVNNNFGAPVDELLALDASAMLTKYASLKTADTVTVKFKAKVNSVCQKKGCWMRLDLGDGKEAMVRFKDYGFFMPKDIAEKEVVVHGQAFVEETSVEDLQHYAKDAGKTQEEIAAITQVEKTYSFTAGGVLLTQ